MSVVVVVVVVAFLLFALIFSPFHSRLQSHAHTLVNKILYLFESVLSC